MNYAVERKLNEKADKSELHNVQNENQKLKSHIRGLEIKIGDLEGGNSNICYALEGLFNLVAEHPQFSGRNEIYDLRDSL